MTATDQKPAENRETEISHFRNFLFSTGRSKATVGKRVTALRKVLASIGPEGDLPSLAGDSMESHEFWAAHLSGLSSSQAEQARPLKILLGDWLADAKFLKETWPLSAVEFRPGSSSLRLAAERCGAQFAYAPICPQTREIGDYFGQQQVNDEPRETELLISEFPFSAFAGTDKPDPVIIDEIKSITPFVEHAETTVLRVDWFIGHLIGSNPSDYLRVFSDHFPKHRVQVIVAPYKHIVPLNKCDLFVVITKDAIPSIRPVGTAMFAAPKPKPGDIGSLSSALGLPEHFPLSFEGAEEILLSSAAVPVAEMVFRGVFRATKAY